MEKTSFLRDKQFMFETLDFASYIGITLHQFLYISIDKRAFTSVHGELKWRGKRK